MGNEVVQLRERHWRIFSLSGTLETVRGRGVVGRVSPDTRPATFVRTHHVTDPCHVLLCLRSPFCLKNNQLSSTAATCLYRPRVDTCGEFTCCPFIHQVVFINVSWCPLMFVSRGTFRIERTDGSHFDVRIPPFSLESNKDDKAPPAGYTF